MRALILVLALTGYCLADRIEPSRLEYLGAFNPPAFPWTSATDKVRYSWGLSGLAYRPDGDGGKGSLFGTSHAHSGLIGEFTIPEPKKTGELETALPLQDFIDSAKPFRGRLGPKTGTPIIERPGTGWRLAGLALVEAELWYAWQEYHTVEPNRFTDDPTHGRINLDFSRPRFEGIWKIGPYGSDLFHQKWTAEYMTPIPSAWTNENLPGFDLAVGKGSGSGAAGNSRGPALFAIRRPESLGFGEVIEGPVQLLGYPFRGRDFEPWSICDVWGAAAWIDTGAAQAVLFAGRHGEGAACFNQPENCAREHGRTSCEKPWGFHCDPYTTKLLFYDPAELAQVAAGDRSPESVLPYARETLDLGGGVKGCTGKVGGMAYGAGRVYLVQALRGSERIIHVWKIGGSEEPPTEEKHVRITIDGKTWEGVLRPAR